MSRPRVLLLTAGSHGDVFPFLGVGRALLPTADVAVLTNPYFDADIRAAGLEPLPLGERIDLPTFVREERLMEGNRGSMRVMHHIFANIEMGIRELSATLDAWRPDVVLSHHICVGARWLLEDREMPHAFASLAPMIWLSPSDPFPAMQKAPGAFRGAMARAAERVVFPIVRRLAGAQINRHRRRHGYPPQPDAFLWRRCQPTGRDTRS